MPAYPCEQCGTPVDTAGDGRCKKCQDRKPFKCSKCGKRIGLLSIYHPERLNFKKPLFCNECGPEVEQIDCRQCGISLMRSNGVEVEVNGVMQVYHHDCYNRQVGLYKRILPIAMIAMFLICGYFGYMLYNAWFMILIGGALGLFVGKAIAKPFALK